MFNKGEFYIERDRELIFASDFKTVDCYTLLRKWISEREILEEEVRVTCQVGMEDECRRRRRRRVIIIKESSGLVLAIPSNKAITNVER